MTRKNNGGIHPWNRKHLIEQTIHTDTTAFVNVNSKYLTFISTEIIDTPTLGFILLKNPLHSHDSPKPIGRAQFKLFSSLDQMYRPRLQKWEASFIQEPSSISVFVGMKREEAGEKKRGKEVVSQLHFLYSFVRVPGRSFIWPSTLYSPG